MDNKKREVLYSKKDIEKRVVELGQQITEEYSGKNLLVVSLLKGAFIFTADLVRGIDLPVRIEFMTTSSYGHSETSSGQLHVIQDIDMDDLSGYDVLVVDDITDSAITMTSVIKHLKEKAPASIKSCVLLDKPSRRQVDYEADYIGFEVEDKFIVGYGLNVGDYYRNIDHVFAFVD